MFDDVNLLPDGNGSRIDERKSEELLVIRTYLKNWSLIHVSIRHVCH